MYQGRLNCLGNSGNFSGGGKPIGYEQCLNRMCPHFNYLHPIKAFIYKGFRPPQECSKNARRVPLNALQISKNQQLRPPFLAYFYLPEILKSLSIATFRFLLHLIQYGKHRGANLRVDANRSYK